MDFAYIFDLRVPFFGYDERLFRFFMGRGGKWNKTQNEITLNGKVRENAMGVLFVLVEDKSPVKVFGFLGRPWEPAESMPPRALPPLLRFLF
jgi:hypothetical protein